MNKQKHPRMPIGLFDGFLESHINDSYNIELHNNDFLVHESHNKDPPIVESNNKDSLVVESDNEDFLICCIWLVLTGSGWLAA